MTTTTKARKRAAVPAVDQTTSSTSALDALATAALAPGTAHPLPLAALHPHPRNPRRDLGDLTELVDSIRAHGIRQNLLVVPDPDHPGEYRIVIGHRRAAAAAAAGLDYAPAVVDEHLTDAEQLELMLLENVQRADLTPIEEADGYQGLLDLGLDVAAIAQRTGRSASTVRARLKIAALPEPAREKIHAHQATIDDALALAEFDGPDDLREQLLQALGQPGFAHLVERARQDARARELEATLRAELEAAGVRIVERGEYGGMPKNFTQLYFLASSSATAHDRPAMTPEEHADCPGAVAYIARYPDRPEAVYGCDDAKKYGHEPRWPNTLPAQPQEDRREVVANNRAAAAAEVVRRQWIRDLLKRPKLPADAVVYAARLVRPGVWIDNVREAGLYTDFLPDPNPDTTIGATRHLVALAAARAESSMGKDFWRTQSQDRRLHLEQLAAWGYELADVERAYLKRKVGRSS